MNCVCEKNLSKLASCNHALVPTLFVTFSIIIFLVPTFFSWFRLLLVFTIMGAGISNVPGIASHKRGWPDDRLESKYDPLYGFPKGRKKRVMIATEEEMDSALIPSRKRDYCAHLYIKLLACRNDNTPFFGKCAHEQHTYYECEYEDLVLRMKEYEREKRLDDRQKRIQKKQEAGQM